VRACRRGDLITDNRWARSFDEKDSSFLAAIKAALGETSELALLQRWEISNKDSETGAASRERNGGRTSSCFGRCELWFSGARVGWNLSPRLAEERTAFSLPERVGIMSTPCLRRRPLARNLLPRRAIIIRSVNGSVDESQ